MRDPAAEETKNRVREASDLVAVVRGYGVELKRAGRMWTGLCPFHNEKSPSFNVNAEGQFFKCFGCGKGGDVFSFVMGQERVEFPEALRILADRAHIPLKAFSPEQAAQVKKDTDWKSYLYKLNQAAAAFYRDMLHARDGKPARDYLEKRGLTPEICAEFGIGFAPPNGPSLLQKLTAQKAPLKALERAGLIGLREEGSPYDYFRGRVLFPITDAQNRVIGFGGRVLDDGEPKYLNTRETPLFSKGKTMYGLAQAREQIAKERRAVLVEGYTDVMMCHQYGIKNVVAALGTAVTADHIRALRRMADEVVLLTDADAAGARASERSVEVLLQEDFPARIVRLPGGKQGEAKDPCEFLLESGAEPFKEALTIGLELFDYKYRRVAAVHDLRTAAGHAAAAKELLEVIALSPNEMLRARLRRELSSKLGLDERTLLSAEAEAKATRARVKAQDERAQQAAQPAWKRGVPEPEHPLAHAERELLRFLFHQPAWLETALGDLDLNALSGKPEQRIGRALWMGLDAGRLPPAAPECNADVTSADIVARVVLDFLTRQEIGASNAVSEANEDYIPRAVEESEGGAEVEAARQVAITLASAPMKLEKAKPHEAYSSCLRPLAKLRLEMDLKAVKRAKAAALAANDPDGLAAAEEREQELQKTLLSMKRSA